MDRPHRLAMNAAALGAAVVIVAVGAAPFLVAASDHLDAPNLGAVSVDGGGTVSISTTGHEDRDIADLYAFRGANPSHTVLVLTSNPAVNAGVSPARFGSDVRYTININRSGGATPDLSYEVRFSTRFFGGQFYWVTRIEGRDRHLVSLGFTGHSSSFGGVTSFAGERSDPFFFDLLGFLGSVKGEGVRRLDDGQQADFFAHLDVMAIVLEVPTASLGGTKLGIWATTQYRSGSSWVQADQVGRPAINTVFNATAGDKEAFNTTPPAQQPTALGGRFTQNVVSVLESFGYSATQAGQLAGVLLPDVLTYDVTKPANGAALNGRGLADDVIDAELGIVTDGHVTTDMVGPHTDYLATFPYLGTPHP